MNKITTGSSLFLFIFFLFSSEVLAENVALVQQMKGEVSEILSSGDIKVLKKGDWVEEGSVVKASKKSFVRLKFVDNSTMNISPNSEIKIERFSKSEAGVINVIKGKIRSQVTKNYLEMEKDKSKLFIKSKTAVMGIRGTDFLFSTNAKTGNTTAVLFEGSVVFNKHSGNIDNTHLEKIVSNGRHIGPHQFSTVTRSSRPTVPAKLNSNQFNHLRKNNFENADKEPIKKRFLAKRSIVPPGLSGEVVSSSTVGLQNGMRGISSVITQKEFTKDQIRDSKGYLRGDDFKPVDGSIVHLDSGVIIPVPKDSFFNKETGEWVSKSIGGVNDIGEYTPPVGYSITDDGKLIKEFAGQDLQKENKVVEVEIVAKPLDKNESFDNLPTKIVSLDDISSDVKSHLPASSADMIDDKTSNTPSTETEQVREPSSTSSLPEVPRPEGTSYQPPSYNSTPPASGGAPSGSGRTRVNFILK